MRVLGALCFAFLIAATPSCIVTATDSPPLETIQSVPAGKSLVLFSTTAVGEGYPEASLYLVQGSTHKKYEAVFLPLTGAPSDFYDETGLLHSMFLPEGEYFLVPYLHTRQYGFDEAPVYRFIVKSKEVVYIGSFKKLNETLRWTGKDAERDIKLFKSRNPAFRDRSMEHRSPDYFGPISDFKIEGTIKEPP